MLIYPIFICNGQMNVIENNASAIELYSTNYNWYRDNFVSLLQRKNSSDSVWYFIYNSSYIYCFHRLFDGNKVCWVFYKDVSGVWRDEAVYVGSFNYSALQDYNSVTGTWYTYATGIIYCTAAGATFTTTFTGSGIDLYSYSNVNGGLWSFSIDGGDVILVSVYNPTLDYKISQIARNLSLTGTHTIVGTFLGQDPAHPTATPIGWMCHGTADKKCHIVYNITFNNLHTIKVVSNSEIAAIFKKNGVGYSEQFFPYHGDITSTNSSTVVKVDGITISDFTTRQIGACTNFTVNQTGNIFNTNEPTEILATFTDNMLFDKRGYDIYWRLTFSQTTSCSVGYAFMVPAVSTWATDLQTKYGNIDLSTLDQVNPNNLTGSERYWTLRYVNDNGTTLQQSIAYAFYLKNKNGFREGQANRASPLMFVQNTMGKWKLYPKSCSNKVFSTNEIWQGEGIYFIGVK